MGKDKKEKKIKKHREEKEEEECPKDVMDVVKNSDDEEDCKEENKEATDDTIQSNHKEDSDDNDLMAVNLEADAPLSRKQRRLKKKEEMIAKSTDKESKAEKDAAAKPKRSQHGVWIGNLTYATDKKMLTNFFSTCGKPTRVHLPSSRPGTNRGFAYVDFETEKEVEVAIAQSEMMLDGRKVLIKNANDFMDGARPRGNQRQRQANPPAVTLFVGNLPFDATKIDMQKLFSPFGKLRKVRLMTFEDTGKCKGFAYIDYMELESAKAAVESPKSHYLQGRLLRVEYGSGEAVKRGAPWIHDPKGLTKRQKRDDEHEHASEQHENATADHHDNATADHQATASSAMSVDEPERQSRRKRRKGETATPLAPPAPLRGPMAAVPFEGTKVTFD
ncbi:hypothetical protein BDF19DRAFT_438858 [Syncephalis fuscata]|nr:hypothetical protein BDF19DRAFT_438858 [Syncephalis fuscata]